MPKKQDTQNEPQALVPQPMTQEEAIEAEREALAELNAAMAPVRESQPRPSALGASTAANPNTAARTTTTTT